MKFLDIEQRTQPWYEARLGKPTASKFGDFINAKGDFKPGGAMTYEAELLAEKLIGFDERKQQRIESNPAVRYGIDTEPEALEELRKRHLDMADVLPGGFFTDDRGSCGASPDGRIEGGNKRELVEIKCPEITTVIKTQLYGFNTGSTGDGYWAQLQGQLMLSGYACVHFFVYRHDCPSFYRRIDPDPAYIAKLRATIDVFCARLEEHEALCRSLGRWG